MRKIFFLPISFLFVWLFVPAAFAQSGNGSIEISPLIMELEVENDKSYLREVVVSNNNSVDYEVTFEAFDVEVDPETHNIAFLAPESKKNTLKSLAAWVFPESPTTFVISPGQAVPFRYRLSSPVGAAAGDYYGSLNFYYKPLAQQQNGNIKVRQSLGCLMLVSLNGVLEAPAPASPYTISSIAFNRGAENTDVSIDFMNNTLRFAHLKPLITLKTPAGEIYFQKEGRSKRVFPGEKTTISHSFPNIYLAGEEPLTLHYTLWDKVGKMKFYEEIVPLESLRMAPAFAYSRYRVAFILGAVVLLAGVVIVTRMRCRQRLSMKPFKKGRRRK